MTLGIVGHGDFGAFIEEFAHRYVPKLEVRIFSRRHQSDGERFYSFEEVCASDLVVIAVSIRAFEDTLEKVLPCLGAESVLIEVNTVKTMPVSLLKKLAGDRKYIATHPMFGPYSFKKQGESLEGLRLVIADHTLPEDEYASATRFLSSLGLLIHVTDAETHDRMLAETLFLTHYLAQTVAAAGFVRTDIDTLSFGYLMDAVESVKSDIELFKGVYEFNPYCKEVVKRLKTGQEHVDAML